MIYFSIVFVMITALLSIPFCIVKYLVLSISGFFAIIAMALDTVQTFLCPQLGLYRFNPFFLYKRMNESNKKEPGVFHPLTGRRKKGM